MSREPTLKAFWRDPGVDEILESWGSSVMKRAAFLEFIWVLDPEHLKEAVRSNSFQALEHHTCEDPTDSERTILKTVFKRASQFRSTVKLLTEADPTLELICMRAHAANGSIVEFRDQPDQNFNFN